MILSGIGAYRLVRNKDEILAAKIKKFLAHPVTWQPSADDLYLVGHMILKKFQENGTKVRMQW